MSKKLTEFVVNKNWNADDSVWVNAIALKRLCEQHEKMRLAIIYALEYLDYGDGHHLIKELQQAIKDIS